MIPVSGTTAVIDSGIKPESGMEGEVGTYGCPVGLGNPGTPPLVPHSILPVTTQHLSAQHTIRGGIG